MCNYLYRFALHRCSFFQGLFVLELSLVYVCTSSHQEGVPGQRRKFIIFMSPKLDKLETHVRRSRCNRRLELRSASSSTAVCLSPVVEPASSAAAFSSSSSSDTETTRGLFSSALNLSVYRGSRDTADCSMLPRGGARFTICTK